jgi:hypothetical protein
LFRFRNTSFYFQHLLPIATIVGSVKVTWRENLSDAPQWDHVKHFDDADVFVRRNVQFKAGDNTLAVGDYMRLEHRFGKTDDLAIIEQAGKPTAFKIQPKMVFHNEASQCHIALFLDEMPTEVEKKFLTIYERATI